MLFRLFLVFVTKLSQLQFLRSLPKTESAESLKQSLAFSPEDDLDTALYYLRTLSNMFRWAPEAFHGVLATRSIEEPPADISEISEYPETAGRISANDSQLAQKAKSHFRSSSFTSA